VNSAGAFDKQADGLRVESVLHPQQREWRLRKRWNAPDDLGPDPHGRTAGHQQLQVRARLQQCLSHASATLEQVLAIIQYEQAPAFTNNPGECSENRLTRYFTHAE
jgi:hypothetical protein